MRSWQPHRPPRPPGHPPGPAPLRRLCARPPLPHRLPDLPDPGVLPRNPLEHKLGWHSNTAPMPTGTSVRSCLRWWGARSLPSTDQGGQGWTSSWHFWTILPPSSLNTRLEPLVFRRILPCSPGSVTRKHPSFLEGSCPWFLPLSIPHRPQRLGISKYTDIIFPTSWLFSSLTSHILCPASCSHGSV